MNIHEYHVIDRTEYHKGTDEWDEVTCSFKGITMSEPHDHPLGNKDQNTASQVCSRETAEHMSTDTIEVAPPAIEDNQGEGVEDDSKDYHYTEEGCLYVFKQPRPIGQGGVHYRRRR